MRTLGLSPLILADRHGRGESLLALFTDEVIGRHGHTSLEASIQAKISNWPAKSTNGSSKPLSLKKTFFM